MTRDEAFSYADGYVKCCEAMGMNKSDQYEFYKLMLDILKEDKKKGKHGNWGIVKDFDGNYGVCSECGRETTFWSGKPVEYCSRCGARMDGKPQKLCNNIIK